MMLKFLNVLFTLIMIYPFYIVLLRIGTLIFILFTICYYFFLSYFIHKENKSDHVLFFSALYIFFYKDSHKLNKYTSLLSSVRKFHLSIPQDVQFSIRFISLVIFS